MCPVLAGTLSVNQGKSTPMGEEQDSLGGQNITQFIAEGD